MASFQPNGGAKLFCNILQRAQKLPETNTSCAAILILYVRPGLDQALANGEFGKVVKQQSWLGEYVLAVVEVTVERLEVLRYDGRIKHMAPDFPLGGNGSFTVKN